MFSSSYKLELMNERKFKMEKKFETDSNYESADTGSEYFSVTDSVEVTQSQQLDWDNGNYGEEQNGTNNNVPLQIPFDESSCRRSFRSHE